MRRRTLMLAPIAQALVVGAAHAADRVASALPSVRILPPLNLRNLGRTRSVRLCLPPSYADGTRRYPVVYMHDGQDLFDKRSAFAGEWGVDEAMAGPVFDAGIEAIIVGVDHGGQGRNSELNPWNHPQFGIGQGRAYLQDLVSVVKPLIDSQYRTLPGREHTTVMGSSMGGLVSHAALLLHGDVFSRAGVLSPAYWTAPAIFDQAQQVQDDARLYLSVGSEEGHRAAFDVRRMYGLVQAKIGSRVTLREVEGGAHNAKAWGAEFPLAMRWLLGRS